MLVLLQVRSSNLTNSLFKVRGCECFLKEMELSNVESPSYIYIQPFSVFYLICSQKSFLYCFSSFEAEKLLQNNTKNSLVAVPSVMTSLDNSKKIISCNTSDKNKKMNRFTIPNHYWVVFVFNRRPQIVSKKHLKSLRNLGNCTYLWIIPSCKMKMFSKVGNML